MTANVACPVCYGAAETVVRPREVAVGRWSTVVQDECFRCQTCGEEFYEPGQLQVTLKKAAQAVRETRGLIAPERIRSLRARYGLTQDQLERLLGVGPKTVVRWERGSVLPKTATSLLLQLLETVPGAVFSLASQRGVTLRVSLPPPVPELTLVEVSRSSTFEAESDVPKEAVA